MPEIVWSALKEENQGFYAREVMANPAFEGVLSAMQASASNAALMSPDDKQREKGRQLYLAIDVIRNKMAEIAKHAR